MQEPQPRVAVAHAAECFGESPPLGGDLAPALLLACLVDEIEEARCGFQALAPPASVSRESVRVSSPLAGVSRPTNGLRVVQERRLVR